MRTGLTKAQKITEITFDEKEPLIHIRTHNTDLKNRLAAYAAHHPTECRQLDADPDTGGMEFTIRKGRLSFRLTAPDDPFFIRRVSYEKTKTTIKP